MPLMPRDVDAATTDVRVSQSAVLGPPAVGAMVADLDQRGSIAQSPMGPTTSEKPPRAGSFLLALLVLIVAGGAAAVVYFALPYFT